MAEVNREDQYDVVHSLHWVPTWWPERNETVNVAHMGCGIRLVTQDTSRPVNCFNCLTNTPHEGR